MKRHSPCLDTSSHVRRLFFSLTKSNLEIVFHWTQNVISKKLSGHVALILRVQQAGYMLLSVRSYWVLLYCYYKHSDLLPETLPANLPRPAPIPVRKMCTQTDINRYYDSAAFRSVS